VDVGIWLRDLGLEQYETAFRANAVDAAILPRLTAEDLKELGVAAVGHRRKLLEAIAALTARPAGSVAPQLPVAEAGGGERRQVTVLFTDLAGYTRLSTELDPEELHAMRRSFTETVDGIVEAHGGTVERHIGDSVMGVFGAPVAHDNDPERAVRAALAVHAAMPELSARFGRALDVHSGVASGEVMAAGLGGPDQGFSVTGETVNLASRLTSEAGTGQILVSAAVRRALAGRLDAVATEALAVKGFAAPVSAWRVLAINRAASDGRPFVGRASEVRHIGEAIAICRDSRRGQAIAIRGEAGIGKTRLVEEIQREAESRGFACHAGLVFDFGTGTGWDAMRSVVRSLAGAATESDPVKIAARAAAVIDAGLVGAERAVFLNDFLDLPQPRKLRAVYDAMDNATRLRGGRETLVELMRAASRSRPVLIVIEDIHWADKATLESIAALGAAASDCAALVVTTSRLDDDPMARGWRIDGPLLTIDLAPLRRDEALALAEGFRAAAADVTQRCIDRAAGNPLFLEQLLRNAEEQAESAVPDSVQSLVQSRVDRLGALDKQALQVASVFGQRFSLAAVRELMGAPDYEPRSLVAHFLVRPQGEEFLFAHALIRDAVYATLLRARRRDLHRQAAAWFATSDTALQAGHLDRADDPGAARAYLAAGREQAQQNRSEDALALAERGLAVARDRAERFALACYRAELLHDLGRIPDARAAFEAALADATDEPERCRVWLGLAGVKRITDDLDGALADVERVEEAAARLALLPEASRARFLHGNLLFFRGDLAGCLGQHQTSLDLARQAGSAELEAAALGGLGDAEYMRGHMTTAGERFRRCVAISEERGFGRIEVANRPMAAIALHFSGDTRGALAEARQAIAAALRVGHKRAETIAHHAAAFCSHSLLDLAAAGAHADRALDLALQLGARRFEAEALGLRAELARLAGARDAALTDIEAALAISRETGVAYLGPFFYGLLAHVAVDAATSDAALAEGERLLATNQIGHNHLLFRRDAIETCIDRGIWDAAENHADALDAYAEREPSPWTRFFAARGRALAAHGRGRRDAALRSEMERLSKEAEGCGFRAALPALKACLAA
jgi:class 3 adenylate cyclase/tetratricopeptide (TPR) repeat protein